MNTIKIHKIPPIHFPERLTEIPDPPQELYLRGTFPRDGVFLTIVGSRKHTEYGKNVCETLVRGLRGLPVVIVSGLALGIDGIAHRAALNAGLPTVAIPGSGLSPKALYPSTHRGLAEKIISSGGALVSEYAPDFQATQWSFPQRNRIMAGLSHAVLIIEATEKSGTLITARLALDYNRDVLAVPGSIYSDASRGANRLLRQGATPITSPEELADALGLVIHTDTPTTDTSDLSSDELKVYALISDPCERDEIIRTLEMPTSEANMLLTAMEIKGLIKEELGVIRKT